MTNLPSQRQRLLLIVAACGLILLLLDRVVITPLTDLWQSHAAEISNLEKSVTTGDSLIRRAAQMQRLWANMQATAFPADPAQSERDLISAFDGWGRSTNIELGSIKPQWKRGANDHYSLLECRIDATGSFSSLGRFLFEVEKSPLALRLESVEITSRDDAGQKLTLTLVVTGLRLSPLEGIKP